MNWYTSSQIAHSAQHTGHSFAGSHLRCHLATPTSRLPRLPCARPIQHLNRSLNNSKSGLELTPSLPLFSSWTGDRRHPTTPATTPKGYASGSGSISGGENPSIVPEEPSPFSSDEEPIVIGEEDQKLKSKFSFENVVYYIQLTYFIILLASIFTGNKYLTSFASFTNFVTAMFLASAAFTGWSATRWLADIRKNLKTAQRDRDFKSLLKYGWSAVFWLGFALWYAIPPSHVLTNWTGTAGAICCLYGIVLAGTSAIMVGSWSFLGPPSTPRSLVTGGPYALLRHPQALGNFLAVIGFSLSGGAVPAAIAFVISFFMYAASTVPQEEKMLMKAFGVKYKHYAENVPAFSWALIVLLILEAVLIWRYGVRPLVPV